MTKKIFITGDAGFIGSHLRQTLQTAGWLVEGYDIRSDPKDDVRDSKRLEDKIRRFKPQGIVHLAAVSRVEEGFLNPRECVEVNVGGLANILAIILEIPMKNRPWLIFGSSREVFGEPKKFPVIEDHPKIPINVYGGTKIFGEMLCENYSRNYGLKTRVLRFSNVYTGLNDRQSRVIPKFIRLALAGEPLTINGGKQIFDFVHIEDTLDGIIKSINNIQKSEKLFDHFNLVTGKKTGLVDLAKSIINVTKSKSKIVFNEERKYDVNKFWGHPGKAKKQLGWTPKIDVNQGLKKVTKHFK